MLEASTSITNPETIEPANTSPDKLPSSFDVSVIMESRPSSHPWADESWNAIGVVAMSEPDQNSGKNREIKRIEQGDIKQFIYSGMKIRLHLDECESYYHNLMSPEPGCFIIASEEDADGNETNVPIPFLVSLSFDEAHAYLEGDATVYSVPIPPVLYRWAEAYIVENYAAEKRTKRKRTDWKKEQQQGN